MAHLKPMEENNSECLSLLHLPTVASLLFIVKPAVVTSGFQVDVPSGFSVATELNLGNWGTNDVSICYTSTKFQLRIKVCSSFVQFVLCSWPQQHKWHADCRFFPIFTNQTAENCTTVDQSDSSIAVRRLWLLTNQTPASSNHWCAVMRQ